MEGGGLKAANKAEIDTSAPFRSVKEAVMLFGERVLAGEVYASKLKEEVTSEYGTGRRTSELEETKQSLHEAREESIQMARCLSSLQEELEQTKRELQQLKTRGSNKCALYLDTEEVKKEAINDKQSVEFQKKKCVAFANPPLVARVAVPLPPAVLQRHPSLKKKKKKPIIPFIGGIFSKKRLLHEEKLSK